MVFTFQITAGTLTENEIANIQPMFGSDGAPVAPEPATWLVWAVLGGIGLGARRWKRHRG